MQVLSARASLTTVVQKRQRLWNKGGGEAAVEGG
jgi:hypothetical protein